ncbi:hypothetical protein P8452_51805 [Trifolium repens]|nr:hypothetical protein P8452_51805 [Trifolium repens]
MSQSRKCPTSDRRNLILNSTTIFYRRRSLRSSRRLQTGTTSLEQVGETHVEVEVMPFEQVAELIEVESSLYGHLNQIAGQNMFEAEAIRHEQVGEMHVENSTLGIPEKAGELGEAAGQNMYEAEIVPLDQEPLAGEIQASRAGCSAPCISLKLTEMVDMVRNEDDDDEVDSTIQSWLEDT